MRVKITMEIEVEVETLTDDELEENDACSAADLAVHDACFFIDGNLGHICDTAEKTKVHVDGHGECEVEWPEQGAGFNGDLRCEVIG